MWVLVFGGVAVAGLVTLVAYAVWLAHKASDLFAEVRVLGLRLDGIAGLLGSIRIPGTGDHNPGIRDYNDVNDPEGVSGK